jgi:hypothetical protein
LFNHYCGCGCFDPRLMTADRISDLIEAAVLIELRADSPWIAHGARKNG